MVMIGGGVLEPTGGIQIQDGAMSAMLDVGLRLKSIGFCRSIGPTSTAKMVKIGKGVLELSRGIQIQGGCHVGHIGCLIATKINRLL